MPRSDYDRIKRLTRERDEAQAELGNAGGQIELLVTQRDEARARIAYIVQTLDAGIPNDDNNRPAEALARDAVRVIATLKALLRDCYLLIEMAEPNHEIVDRLMAALGGRDE